MFNKICNLLERPAILYTLAGISIISGLRTFFLPLTGDEITYVNIATNLLENGNYMLHERASTVTPVVPLIISAFSLINGIESGIFLSRLFLVIVSLVGVFYAHKTISKVVDKPAITSLIVLLIIVNTNFVSAISSLYPDSILFCSLWILLYYLSEDVTKFKNWIYILIFTLLLVLTRYLYAVVGLLVLFAFIKYLKADENKNFSQILQLVFAVLFALIPLGLWFYYVGTVESEQTNSISYFNRFKNHGLLYNLKAGIGLIRHEEVGKVNGVPAFASLFIPITGMRSWLLSIPLLFLSLYGYFKVFSSAGNKIFLIIILIMLGLVFAGTGFSRYWLPLLPAYLLGFYLTSSALRIPEIWFRCIALTVAVIYVFNELRLDILVFNKL
ncbi:hypothetical protein EAX61_11765 [Dokdonia sinensis]|uniref:Uncharacterized protein n=1 Tax=Dokdonia sinensis TaxID=2479847 RepID=A0A3M0GJE0_9FLAO|nr:glycosyltransferase family 39 protein [Dokdonia sinensis]RMB57416.1 hypothetical protein EAX61_11765 [Dokdonia sinensis]